MKTRKQIPTVLVTAALLAQLALPAADAPMPRPDGKPADMTKKVKVFILLGQSNMVGMGKIKGGEGSLENAVKEKKKYPYLVDEAGNWIGAPGRPLCARHAGPGRRACSVQQRMDDRGQMQDDRPGVRHRALGGGCH